MNELETLIHEVHDHVVNNAILDTSVTISIYPKMLININYINFSIYLCSNKVLYGEDAHEIPYIFDKDEYFNISLEDDMTINFNTMMKIASLLEYYNIPHRSYNA